MAKDMNVSIVSVQKGALTLVDAHGQQTPLYAAQFEGRALDGVYVMRDGVELENGSSTVVQFPSEKNARETLLKKWSEKARKHKGLSASLLILPLAACGGASDPAPTPVFEVSVSGTDVVSFLNATAKITVDIASGIATFASGSETASIVVVDLNNNTVNVAAGQSLEMSVAQLQDTSVVDGADAVEFTGGGDVAIVLPEAAAGSSSVTETITVKVNLSGGNLTFDLPSDDNDTIVLSASSSIDLAGGDLIVSDGVVDARLATVVDANSIGDVRVASELILTKAQFDNVTGTVDTSASGRLTVYVETLADAQAVADAQGTTIADGVTLTLAIPNGTDLGALTVEQYRVLDGLVDNLAGALDARSVTYTIEDTAENLMQLTGTRTS